MTDSTESEQAPNSPQTKQPEDRPSSKPSWWTLRRTRLRKPTQEELDSLDTEKRLEVLNQRRQNRHQTANTIAILLGVVFAAGSLGATAISIRNTQKELRNGQEELQNSLQGQITDRYTKAVDQLSSHNLDVRLGGIYALERIGVDSPRDDRTVYDVLCAFVREHGLKRAGKAPDVLPTDLQAAMTVVSRRKPLNDGFFPDLERTRLSNARLTNAKLARGNFNRSVLDGAYMSGADLSNANMFNAILGFADLHDATLTGALIASGDLFSAILDYANLSHADLDNANISHATLRYANLTGADLGGANLTGADLTGANLTGADLRGADLRGADLSATGQDPGRLRQIARTDGHTRF